MSSHQAEDQHLEFVRKWLVILGRSEDELACGVEYPDEFARIRDILERRIPIGRAFNNCSGKHTGMIAACLASNFDPQNYNHWDHPLQKKIRQIATELSGFQWEKTPFGIDGCGLPIYHIPMNVFALTMSRFLRPELWPYADAMSLLRQAWIKEPYMIAGHGDVCSEITKITRGRICAKIGAQGNFVAFDFHQGRCLVLKVHDGDSRSAREALLAILLKSGSITSDEHSQLREFVPRNILNWAGDSVGFVTVQI